MPKNKTSKKKIKTSSADKSTRSIIIKLLTASFIGAAVFFILIAIASYFAYKQDMSPDNYSVLALVACVLSSVVCSVAAVRPFKRNGLLIGMASILPMFFIIFAVVSAVNRAALSTTGWVSFGVMLLTGGLAGIFTANKKKKNKIK